MKHSGGLYNKRCDYCHKSFKSSHQVSRHVAHSESCQRQWEKHLQKVPAHRPACQVLQKEDETHYEKDDDLLEEAEADIDHDDYVLPARDASDMNIELHVEGLVEGRVETREVDENAEETVGSPYRHTRWIQAFSGRVAEGYGKAKTTFDDWREKQMLTGASKWSPFVDEDEWELAQWLFKNVGLSAIEEYLKLPSVSFLPFKEKLLLTYI